MSISIEKLKFLANGLDGLGNLYISDEAGDCPGHARDVLAALKELIAIKEQKPVMYAPDFGDGRGPDYFFSFITAEEVEAECDGYVEIVPLIRKPE